MARVAGERRFMLWVEQTRGASLELPDELLDLAESQHDCPASVAGALRMGNRGPFKIGDAIRCVRSRATLAARIDEWSRIGPSLRTSLTEYLHCYAPGALAELRVSLDHALTWLRSCLAPVAPEPLARLDLPPETTWGAACQALKLGEPVPASAAPPPA